MKPRLTIITIGLAPCWDITCRIDGIDWGQHKQVAAASIVPAGKSMNVSRALAWMHQSSIAAGLWGKEDFSQLSAAQQDYIDYRLTAVPGRTRQNINVVDTKNSREMHLRSPSTLATAATLGTLRKKLKTMVGPGSICVFSGSMPNDGLLDEIKKTIDLCSSAGAKIVLDTNGPALKYLVSNEKLFLLKPNIEELSQLLGAPLKNDTKTLISAARGLLNSVEIILLSRGEKGALLITKNSILDGCCLQRRKAQSTVACGDFLLAGFLAEYVNRGALGAAIENAIVCATARAWALDAQSSFKNVKTQIDVQIKKI